MQILGAEKALFRALKTKHETPKYGLIYHASLIGQASPKNKGKMSRVLAAKCALSIRVDAMGDSPEPTIGLESRAMVRTLQHAADPEKSVGIPEWDSEIRTSFPRTVRDLVHGTYV